MVARPNDIPAPEELDQDVVLYITPWCGYCRMALRLLERKGTPHAVIDVTGNQPARAWLRAITGRHTVPQIFIKGESIGGYTELAALERQGDLDARLRSSAG